MDRQEDDEVYDSRQQKRTANNRTSKKAVRSATQTRGRLLSRGHIPDFYLFSIQSVLGTKDNECNILAILETSLALEVSCRWEMFVLS